MEDSDFRTGFKTSQTQRPSRKRKILILEQHGFRPRLSTSHQLLRVVEFIKEGNNKDECTAAVFLDIQKAFDRGESGRAQEGGEKPKKRVRGAPKRSSEKELQLFFSRGQNEKEWSLQVETYKRNSRRKMQDPAFSLIPLSTSGKGI
ncbi:hypothetical protein TNCV_4493061 [Trichonephila clavipes]|uniref:Uncharacterized protein n=1 Tax=Trichonephila clavipes TaxID=2585209 RepID=A0A8X6VNK2_TRICX|nr:hypothetical protein TNCV_4493061 [Trichonephila clavipes]